MSKSTTKRAPKPSPKAPAVHPSTTIGEIMQRRCPGLEADPTGYSWDELVLACQEVAGEITFDLTTADHEVTRRPLLVALVALAHDALDAFDRRFAVKGAKPVTRRAEKVDPVTDLVGAYNLGGKTTEAAHAMLADIMAKPRSREEHREALMMVRMMIDAAIVEGTPLVMSLPPAGYTHMLALAQRLTMITYDRLADTDGGDVFFRALADMFAKSATVCGESAA